MGTKVTLDDELQQMVNEVCASNEAEGWGTSHRKAVFYLVRKGYAEWRASRAAKDERKKGAKP